MAQKKQKNISLKSIDKHYKKISKYSQHPLKCQNDEVIKYYEFFTEDKIDDLFKEANNDLLYDIENKLFLISDDDEKFYKYILFLIIKHMTQLRDEIPDNLEEKIVILHKLYDKGIFKEMLEEVFNPAEISKVIERLADISSMNERIREMEQETRKSIIESVQSPVIKKKLEEGLFDAKV